MVSTQQNTHIQSEQSRLINEAAIYNYMNTAVDPNNNALPSDIFDTLLTMFYASSAFMSRSDSTNKCSQLMKQYIQNGPDMQNNYGI